MAANPPQGQGQAVPPAVQFALSPAGINANQPIDYSTSEGIKMYRVATAPLLSPYDVDAKGLAVFLDEVAERAKVANWNHILTIPVAGKDLNLLTQYGQIDTTDVQAFVDTYVDTDTRKAQDAAQLATFLLASLSHDGRAKITNNKEKYTRGQASQPDGPMLLKYIISKAHIDTRATVSYIRNSLIDLDKYMVDVNSDIILFNQFVDQQISMLSHRGEKTTDLLNYLFNGYKAATDREFIKYIQYKITEWEDGKELTPAQLMDAAANKYRSMVQANEWNAPSKEEEQIVALTAQIQKLEKSNSKKPFSPSSKAKATSKKTDKKGSKKSNLGNPKKDNHADDAWKSVPPNAGQVKKTIDGKEWIWCATHRKWANHHEKDCHLKKKLDAEQSGPAPTLRMANNLAAIIQEDED